MRKTIEYKGFTIIIQAVLDKRSVIDSVKYPHKLSLFVKDPNGYSTPLIEDMGSSNGQLVPDISVLEDQARTYIDDQSRPNGMYAYEIPESIGFKHT